MMMTPLIVINFDQINTLGVGVCMCPCLFELDVSVILQS